MAVGSLCRDSYKFYIPYYQRGYRWRKCQVDNLLNDIAEFLRLCEDKNFLTSCSGNDIYYSLQPLVVRYKNNRWTVIDGQQRLTTIYLLAHKLMPGSPLFEIEYESRNEISDFLKKISTSTTKAENTEQDFLLQAYKIIDGWVNEYCGLDPYSPQKLALIGLLSARETDTKRLQFIWYNISDQCKTDNDEIDLFNRLNKGHLSLTSAELIKAGFCEEIRSRTTEKAEESKKAIEYEEQRFFREWNEIENQFQDDSFWGFIYNEKLSDKKYDTRIEYLFDLLIACQSEQPEDSGKAPAALISSDDAYITFHNYEEHKKLEKKKNKSWDEREELWSFYQTLLSWYHDRQFYHLIGFLVQTGESLSSIKLTIENPENTTREKMIAALRNRISQTVFEQCSELYKFLEDLDFNRDKGKIRDILLLFNIEYLLQNESSQQRFQFDSYQSLSWDLEHICSRTNIPGDKDRKSWTENVLRYMLKMPLLLPGGQKKDSKEKVIEKFKEKIESSELLYGHDPTKTEEEKSLRLALLQYFVSETNTEKDFIELYKRTRALFDESEDIPKDDLTNLTLLDAGTNRGYGNSPFAVKRQYIIEKEKASLFIPPCTRDVFMKTFSVDAHSLLYWIPNSDGVHHLRAISELLKKTYDLK